jgi:pyrroline-5-carboxylate reductase
MAATGAGASSGGKSAGACGFIGFGTINSGIATGLATCDDPPPAIIAFDPAPERALHKFQGEFPAVVTVAESNQAVVDGADTVFVGLLPQHAEAVLAALTWRVDMTVVCMVAMTTHAQLSEYVRPARALVRAVPIPPPWKRASTILLYNTAPVPPPVEALFSKLGTVIVGLNPIVTLEK